MSSLHDQLSEELKGGHPGTAWFDLIQSTMKLVAGNWPQEYFSDIDLDSRSSNWKYAEKLDLSMKYFEDEIQNPKRSTTSFILLGSSDQQIRGNLKKSISQFLSEITKGEATKRVYKLLEARLNQRGIKILDLTEATLKGCTIETYESDGASIKKILMRCRKRLPNAFTQAGEGERNSPIWSSDGYLEIVEKILQTVSSITEPALRRGISEALSHLQLSLYLDDVEQHNAQQYSQATEDMSYEPAKLLLAAEEQKWAEEVMTSLSDESKRTFEHVCKCKFVTELGQSLGVHRLKARELASSMEAEILSKMSVLEIPEESRGRVRTEMRILSIRKPLGAIAEAIAIQMPRELTIKFLHSAHFQNKRIHIPGKEVVGPAQRALMIPDEIMLSVVQEINRFDVQADELLSIAFEIKEFLLKHREIWT